jgi:polysaccharide chain length determinant protein (PEP-CTERM system associated)
MNEPYSGYPNPQGGIAWQNYWKALVRHRWWLLGPLFGFGLLGFVLASLWPRLYRSEALILVEQQKVPEQYVTPNISTDVQTRLQGMTQTILSRTRLQRLIEQFNLYPRERAHLIIDDVVDKMRAAIKIEPVKTSGHEGQLTAFVISYAADNPRVAQQITNQLTSAFIEENLQDRTEASERTTQFLDQQVDSAQKDLAEKEQRLREYKMRYLGELPEQEQSNLQILSSLETQLHADSDALARAEQQRIYLESVRSEYSAHEKVNVPTSSGGGAQASGPSSSDLALKTLRAELADAEAKYTPQHPDVVRLKGEIAKWESLKKKVDADPASSAHSASSAADAGTAPTAMIEIEGRLKAVQAETAGYKREIADLQARIQASQSHLSLTPVREQELSTVTRGYENSRNNYQSLLARKLSSELATNLERRQQGEQFHILDPASLPQKPNEPNQVAIVMAGWAIGLVGGIALVTLKETTKRTLGNEQDVAQLTQLPILVRIPVLRSPAEDARQRWRTIVEGAVLMVLFLISAGTGIYTYLQNS